MRPAIVAILSLFLAATLAAAQGTITTVAGTGVAGFSGDGGPATNARLNYPSGLTIDKAGNLYIADSNNMRVRRVSPAGIITTVAGNGIGDFTGENGRAVSESLWWPSGLVLDSADNLYISDENNNRVRKVSPSGIMTTVAGGGECCGLRDGGPATRATLNRPHGLALDANGNLYIGDWQHARVRRVSPHGEITTIAGYGGIGASGDGGPATNAAIQFPEGIAFDTAGNLYVCFYYGVRKVTPGGTITTVIGVGPFYGVAVDGSGNLYLASGDRVYKVGASGLVTSVAGGGSDQGDGIPSTQARLANVTAIAIDKAGNLYIADGTHRIRKVMQ